MCGRYSLILMGVDIEGAFDIILDASTIFSRYNIAPGQEILAVANQGERRAHMLKWGFIPAGNKDPKGGRKPINARGETVADKWPFKYAFQGRRCLIPADGFYEWRKTDQGKVPYRITLRSRKLFAFAGIWDRWVSPEEETVETCCMITTVANSLMETIHNRMPVILTKDAENLWLDPSSSVADLRELLVPYSAEEMDAYQVGSDVNNWRNDGPEIIEPGIAD